MYGAGKSNFKFTQVVDTSHKAPPYRLNLNQGFVPGHELTVSGVATFNEDRFNVDFVSQSFNNRDVAFHFNPRFNDHVVVRNSQFSTSWGNEERDGGMPIYRGQSFTIMFRCDNEGFRVYINGNLFTLYRHRQAPGLISHVNIGGAVSVTSLTYHANSNFKFTQVVDTSHKAPPYRLNLNQGFVPGHELTVSGVATFNEDRFNVDFVSQSFNNRDVAFHFNPRFNDHVVVRNSQFSTSWGNEERDGGMPIYRGQSFTIMFRCDNEGFRVYINGNLFTLYRHRQAPGLISHVNIGGAVSVTSLTYHANVRPGVGPSASFFLPLQNSFSPGCELTIVGQPQAFEDRFAVNLQSGQGPNVNKMLHFNPRFRDGVVVRNSFLNGGWGNEERDGRMPFRTGATCTLLLRCEADGFKIFVNGNMQTFFVHRQSPHMITTLEINGGINVTSVSYHSRMAGIAFNHVLECAKHAPYSFPLTHSFLAGSEITITGTADYGADRFHIDLRADRSGPQDIAFHLNPRFNQGIIVRNSFLGEEWGPEETDGDLPIIPGEPFTISIHSEQQEYKVFVNGSFFTSYQLRHASALVTHVDVAGSVMIDTATYQAMVAGIGFVHQPSISLLLSNGFAEGSEVTVVGKSQRHAERFDVNLVSEDPPETTLHFNPRFNEGVVVRNTFSGGWGAEERHGGQPFQPGEQFTLKIVCERRGFKIFVDGNLYTFYGHRGCPDTINSLNISGGSQLLLVTYKPKLPQE